MKIVECINYLIVCNKSLNISLYTAMANFQFSIESLSGTFKLSAIIKTIVVILYCKVRLSGQVGMVFLSLNCLFKRARLLKNNYQLSRTNPHKCHNTR